MAKGTTNAQGGGDENAIVDVALGSDGKSLDFTAAGGQVNNVTIPSCDCTWNSTTYSSLYTLIYSTYGKMYDVLIQFSSSNSTKYILRFVSLRNYDPASVRCNGVLYKYVSATNYTDSNEIYFIVQMKSTSVYYLTYYGNNGNSAYSTIEIPSSAQCYYMKLN